MKFSAATLATALVAVSCSISPAGSASLNRGATRGLAEGERKLSPKMGMGMSGGGKGMTMGPTAAPTAPVPCPCSVAGTATCCFSSDETFIVTASNGDIVFALTATTCTSGGAAPTPLSEGAFETCLDLLPDACDFEPEPSSKSKGKGKGGSKSNVADDSCPCFDESSACIVDPDFANCDTIGSGKFLSDTVGAGAGSIAVSFELAIDSCSVTIGTEEVITGDIVTLAQYDACVAALNDVSADACDTITGT